MRKIVFTLVMLGMSLLGNAQSKKNVVKSKHPSLNYATVECVELNAMLSKKNPPIVIFCGDVTNEKDKYTYSYSKIKGALAIGSIDQKGWQGILNSVLKGDIENKRFSKEVVVYCGCCSSDNCPNVEPVIQELKKLGFKNVTGLYMPSGYLPDWHAKKFAEEVIR